MARKGRRLQGDGRLHSDLWLHCIYKRATMPSLFIRLSRSPLVVAFERIDFSMQKVPASKSERTLARTNSQRTKPNCVFDCCKNNGQPQIALVTLHSGCLRTPQERPFETYTTGERPRLQLHRGKPKRQAVATNSRNSGARLTIGERARAVQASVEDNHGHWRRGAGIRSEGL